MGEFVRDITCSLCKTSIAKFDEWLTSDSTEGEVIVFVEQGCSAIGSVIPGAEAACKALVEAKLPELIEGLVEDNLNPTEVCTSSRHVLKVGSTCYIELTIGCN